MTKLEEMMRKQSSHFKAFSRALTSIDVDKLSEKWEYEDALTTIKARWKAVDTLHWEIDSETHKMRFLKGKLRGEPEMLVQHLQISSENFLASWEILNHRYNNKKLIFTSHIKTIMNLTTIQQPSSHL
ncbi:uncharacterized protein LOC132904113 [Amyelois transitella]|uniref:uncharacterized protein LOC132904113 n=1 Tax=Amyelois transitella TaxID=680683 RepID=UPI0029906D47|nr:uncharacterized protein LOC132904113 [Amyelois transitella]